MVDYRPAGWSEVKKMKRLLIISLIVLTIAMPIHQGVATPIDTIKLKTGQTSDFYVTYNRPDNATYLEQFNFSLQIELKATATSKTNVQVNITLRPGLNPIPGETVVKDLGTMNPGDIKNINFTLYASESSLSNALVLCKIFILVNGDQQYIETPIETAPYIATNIEIFYAIVEVDGPLEAIGVKNRIKLFPNDEANLTFVIKNTGKVSCYNLTFFYEKVGTDAIDVIGISSTFLDELEGRNNHTVVLTIKNKVDYASEVKLFFYADSDAFDLIGIPANIETIDWFNAYGYDNVSVFFVWPAVILFEIIFLGYMIHAIRRKRRLRKEKLIKLEETYGTAKYDGRL